MPSYLNLSKIFAPFTKQVYLEHLGNNVFGREIKASGWTVPTEPHGLGRDARSYERHLLIKGKCHFTLFRNKGFILRDTGDEK